MENALEEYKKIKMSVRITVTIFYFTYIEFKFF